MPRLSRRTNQRLPVKAQKPDVRRFLRDTFTFIVTVALLLTMRSLTMPVLGSATYTVQDKASVTTNIPFFIPSIASTMRVSVPLTLSAIHPQFFSIQVDDCIERLMINGQRVIPEQLHSFCSPHDKTHINLGKWLMPGMNTLLIELSDIGVTEGLDIGVSPVDPLMLFFMIALVGIVAWYALRIRSLSPKRPVFSSLITLLIIGFVIRLLYVNATSYGVRTHDLDGHLDYIKFIRLHWHLPMASQGWEFHQAPLYYAFSAGWMALCARFFSFTETTLFQSLQAWSLLFSVLTLSAALSVVRVLFSPKDRYGIALFGLFLCVFPGVVFFASRISNESLSLLLTVGLIALLLHWWHTPRWRWIIGIGALFALSFVTKVTVLLLLPAVLLTLFFRQATLRIRIYRVLLFCAVVVMLAGWYPALRLVVETNRTKTLSFGNDEMNHDLAVPRDAGHLLTFNPIAMARQPFNDPWSDGARRGYLLEYFFRSSLFGEFKFPSVLWIAYPLIVSLLLLLPCLLYGFYCEVRWSFRRLLPLHLVTVCLAAGAILYPLLFAFASNQDFRFSAALILPCSYYLTRGISHLPSRIKDIALGVFMAFVVCAVTFILALFVQA